jgi:hypothetical protein
VTAESALRGLVIAVSPCGEVEPSWQIAVLEPLRLPPGQRLVMLPTAVEFPGPASLSGAVRWSQSGR